MALLVCRMREREIDRGQTFLEGKDWIVGALRHQGVRHGPISLEARRDGAAGDAADSPSNHRLTSSGLVKASKTTLRGASKTGVITISRSPCVVSFRVPMMYKPGPSRPLGADDSKAAVEGRKDWTRRAALKEHTGPLRSSPATQRP